MKHAADEDNDNNDAINNSKDDDNDDDNNDDTDTDNSRYFLAVQSFLIRLDQKRSSPFMSLLTFQQQPFFTCYCGQLEGRPLNEMSNFKRSTNVLEPLLPTQLAMCIQEM